MFLIRGIPLQKSSFVVLPTFEDSETEYTLVVSSLSQTADIILNLMLRFLPGNLVLSGQNGQYNSINQHTANGKSGKNPQKHFRT